MKVAIVGTGYVGLVSGTCLAEMGHEVMCIDNNEAKIKTLENGDIPIYEPGLKELVKKNRDEGRLTFSTSVTEGVKKCEVIFVAVHTPPLPDGSANLCYVEEVSREIAECMSEYRIIVSKSTVPVETGKWIKKTVDKYADAGADYDVASNPEFLREGKAVDDFLNPDRVVIGVESERAAKKMAELYEPLKEKTEILITNIESSELIKHASNSFLAMKISYINAVSNICEKTNADIEEVARGMGLDKRIGDKFLRAGVGFGGSCFPKDLSAFIKIAEKLGYDFSLLKEVRKINKNQRKLVIEKIRADLWNFNDKNIGILGLAFKADTDDMRNAPSIDIVNQLAAEGANVKAYDPEAAENAKKLLPGAVTYCSDVYETAEGCDILVLLTDWKQIVEMDLKKIKGLLADPPIIVDGRNIFDPGTMKELGIKYTSIGR
ncbi:MAG: UDP-glucose/GDP-mannose dehydrogenase family protein [Elusimicrobiota bacterium]|nr:UDP-glucose/GDP-mannose dehydrogenase family protein [Elusimicrobiota bacterium]